MRAVNLSNSELINRVECVLRETCLSNDGLLAVVAERLEANVMPSSDILEALQAFDKLDDICTDKLHDQLDNDFPSFDYIQCLDGEQILKDDHDKYHKLKLKFDDDLCNLQAEINTLKEAAQLMADLLFIEVD